MGCRAAEGDDAELQEEGGDFAEGASGSKVLPLC
jgi:hypothetical protein